MEDKSTIKPIIDAIEYFNESESELRYFYNVIDKFCYLWFGKRIAVSKFKNIDLYLIHDLLGEYIRFEENNKKIALWLFAINRICFNYSKDLQYLKKEINEIIHNIDDNTDISLISPIINNLIEIEIKHNNVGKNDRGDSDTIGNFLQWVGLYTTFVYPSLENKDDYTDKNVSKAMSFLLGEFIQLKTNDKRLAYLVYAIIEACKNYSLHKNIDQTELGIPPDTVFAGNDEAYVQELLKKLKNENDKQKKKHLNKAEILNDNILESDFDNFLETIGKDENEAVTVFNNFIFELSNRFITLDAGNQFIFLQTLSKYKPESISLINDNTLKVLRESVNLLSELTKKWIIQELGKLNKKNDLYIEIVIDKLTSENLNAKSNSAKLYIMLYMIKKFNLLEK